MTDNGIVALVVLYIVLMPVGHGFLKELAELDGTSNRNIFVDFMVFLASMLLAVAWPMVLPLAVILVLVKGYEILQCLGGGIGSLFEDFLDWLDDMVV